MSSERPDPSPPSSAPAPRVAVVVLTHDSAAVVSTCLDHLVATAYDALEILVVDNASDTVARVVARHPEALVVSAGANLGWAAGNALGVGRALQSDADYVVLLNPDVLVPPGWLTAAVAAMESRPALALMDFDLFSGREGALPGEVQTDERQPDAPRAAARAEAHREGMVYAERAMM